MIPVTDNPKAEAAYQHALWGLIPLAALFFGPQALVLGVQGLRHARATARTPGLGHAWASIILGSLEILTNVAGLACIGVGLTRLLG